MPPKSRSSSKSKGKGSSHKTSFSFSKPKGSLFGNKKSSFSSRNRIRSKGHFSGGRSRFRRTTGTAIAYDCCKSSASYVLPVLTDPFFIPGKISYCGPISNLRNQISTLQMDQIGSVREIILCIPGLLVQE